MAEQKKSEQIKEVQKPTRDRATDSIPKRSDFNESIPAKVQPVEQWSQPEKKKQ